MSAPAPARIVLRRAYSQTFSASIAIRLLGVVSGIIAARALGATGRGELGIVTMLAMQGIAFGELELPRSITLHVCKAERDSAPLVAASFWASLALAGLQAAAFAVVTPYVIPADKAYLLADVRWFLLWLPCTYVLMAFSAVDQGAGRFGRASLFQVLPGLGYTCGAVALLLTHTATVRSMAIATLAATALAALIRLALDGRAVLRARPSLAIARSLFSRGFALYLPTLASLALQRADMFLLLWLAPPWVIGIYVVAQAIATGPVGTTAPFVSVLFAATAAEAERARAIASLARQFAYVQLVTVGVGCVLTLAADVLIRLAFGASFAAAVPVARVLIWAAVFYSLGQVLDQGYRALGHVSPGILSNLLGLLTCIAAIPAYRWGVSAFAGVFLVAQAVNLAVLLVWGARRLALPLPWMWGLRPTVLRDCCRASLNTLQPIWRTLVAGAE
jgi:O-antigen/teichoic acid export membrane protein